VTVSLLTLLSRSITADPSDPLQLVVQLEMMDGTWRDISADVMSGSITRGKTRELDQFTAGTCTLLLRNDDRRYDPNHTFGTYCRLGGATQTRVVTVNSSGFDPTSDLDIRVRVSHDNIASTNFEVYVSHPNSQGGFGFYEFGKSSGNQPYLNWLHGGLQVSKTSTITWAADGLVSGTAYWFGVTLDVDNGAGGNTVKFYYHADTATPPADITTWTLHDTITTAGTTSIDTGTGTLVIGERDNNPNGTVEPLVGNAYAAQLRNGINGPLIVNPDFTKSPWVGFDIAPVVRMDSVGVFWTLNGAAEITNNSGSPYYGSIVPVRRVKIMGLANNTLLTQFTGYINSWQQNFTGPHSATCTVSATDNFYMLSRAALPSSPYVREVAVDSPVHWWRLGESQGTATAYDKVGGGQNFGIFDNPTQAQLGLVTNDDTASTYFFHSQPNRCEYLGGNIVTSFPFTIEAVIKLFPNDDEYRVIYSDDYNVGGAQAFTFRVADSLSAGGAGTVGGGFADATLGKQVVVTSSVRVDDGAVHHVAAVFTSNTSVKIYVDGVDRTVVDTINAAYQIPAIRYRAAIGNLPIEDPGTGQFGFDGFLQEVALYNKSLSATRIAAHASAALTAWAGDSPGARAGRILDIVNLPTSDRVLSTGSSVLQAAKTAGQSAQQHLQTVADSEFGKLFIDVHGAVVLRGRVDGIDQTSQATFADVHNTGLTCTVISPEYTDQLLRNDVIIQRDGGIGEEASDATSIKNYQTNSYSKSGLFHNSDDLSEAGAEYIMANYKDPLQRISGLVVEAHADPVNLFPQVLVRDLGDWITVVYTPIGIPPAITQVTVIEGIRHDFTPKRWVTSYSLSPADTKHYWKLGVTGFGELGVNSRLFF